MNFISNVCVSDSQYYGIESGLYYTNGRTAVGSLENSPGRNLHYDTENGIPDLQNYIGIWYL